MNEMLRRGARAPEGFTVRPSTSRSSRRLVTLMSAILLAAQVVLVPPTVGLAQDTSCPEPNDDVASACPIPANATVRGVIDRPEDRDVYRVVVETPGRFLIDLTDLPADYDLYAIDAVGGVLGQSVHEGTAAEQVQFNVAAGTYFIVVQADLQRQVDPLSPYTLRVAFAPTPTSSSPVAPPAVSNAAPAATSDLRILAQDNFDDPTVGFLPATSSSRDLQIGYVDGEYVVRNLARSPTSPSDNLIRGVWVPGIFGDASISMDVRLIEDATNRSFHVHCRRQVFSSMPLSAQAYYTPITPNTRGFELRRADPQGSVTLAARRGEDAIKPGSEWNHVELACMGSHITLTVNGTELASVSDSAYATGSFAIYVAGPDGAIPRAELRLDNLIIRGP